MCGDQRWDVQGLKIWGIGAEDLGCRAWALVHGLAIGVLRFEMGGSGLNPKSLNPKS